MPEKPDSPDTNGELGAGVPGVPKAVGSQHSGAMAMAVSERALLGDGAGGGAGGGGSTPAWYLLLDRFGFPTLVAVALGWMLFHMIDAEQASHGQSQVVMQKAFDQINGNLDKLNSQAAEQQRTLSAIKDDLKDALRGRR